MSKLRQRFLMSTFVFCFALSSLWASPAAFAGSHIQASTSAASIYGADRYETAAKIAQNGWSSTSDNAILAPGMSAYLIDALLAGPLAAQLDAPIVLTEGDSLNKYAAAVINRLKVKKVYIVGSANAISQQVITQIKALPTVTAVQTLGGADAAETSVNIAKTMAILGDRISQVVVTGGGGADALSAAPIAAAQGMPILYSGRDNISSSVKTYLDGIKSNITNTYIIGGPGVVSDAVKSQLPGTVERYFGQDRYATNLAVLKGFAGAFKYQNTYVANGETLVDAVASVPLAAKTKSIILITGQVLPETSKNYALANLSSHVIGLGGSSVVSPAILAALASGGTGSGVTPAAGGNAGSPPLITPPPPVISGKIRAGNTTVMGTSVPGAKIVLSCNGNVQESAIAAADGTWSVSGLLLAQGDILSVTAQLPGSPISSPVKITVAPIFDQTSPPVITGMVQAGDTSVSGTAANGATIVLSVNGKAQSPAYSNGTWTVNYLTLNAGDQISATAQLPGQTVSNAATASVTIKYPVAGNVTAHSAQLFILNNQANAAYYVVLPSQEINAPSIEQIKAGTDIANVLLAANLRGTISLPQNQVTVVSVSGLSSATNYGVYIAYTGSTKRDMVTFTTLPDKTDKPIISGSVIAGNTVISGTAPANTSVVLRINGLIQATVTANGARDWLFQNLNLIVGDNISVTAQSTGETVSDPAVTTVIAPAGATTNKPVILDPIIAGTNTSISGIAAAGATIVIKDGNSDAVLATVQTGRNGLWKASGLTLVKGRGINITAQITGEALSDPVTAIIQ